MARSHHGMSADTSSVAITPASAAHGGPSPASVARVTEPPHDSAWRPVFAALANTDARRVYASIVLQQSAPGSDLSPSRRKHSIESLRKAGLIKDGDDGLVASDAFVEILHAAPKPTRRTGIDRFLTDTGRIDRYPSKPDDRLDLLQLVARNVLAAHEVLTEAEINERLTRYHDDVATLRRYLVDHELVERLPNGAQYARPSDVALDLNT